MRNILKNILSVLAVLAMLALSIAAVVNAASAATGPWQWSDMSDKLGVRENRPVWAGAFAAPYWYLTDGQELYTGGHVWKTDGSIVTDITAEVRQAGLNRVDDIVSDGTTVLFLKSVVSNTRNFEILSYQDGKWGYPAHTWRQYLEADEALASINGKDGVWMVTTAKGRVFQWTASSNAFQWVNLPVTATNPYRSNVYSVKHASPVTGHSVFIVTKVVPTSGGWIFAIPQTSSYTRLYFYQNGNFHQITNSNLSGINFIASNGNQVILTGPSYTYSNQIIYVIDGSNSRTVNTNISNTSLLTWNNAIAASNGKSWMIVSGKNLYRFDGYEFQSYGETRDYFLTLSGDKNGRMLLGGAVSSLGYGYPNSPLTAKLVRVDEGTGYTPVTNNSNVNWDETIDTVPAYENSIHYWAWFEPNKKNHGNVIDPKYGVGAQSNYGIDKIELYINDVRQRVCDGYDSKGNVGCAMFIESTAYVYGNDVNVNAKVYDTRGRVATVPVRSIRFWAGETGTAGNVTAGMSVSHNAHELYQGQSSNVNITGYSPNGIQKIEVYLNGNIVKQCYGNDCSYTIYGSNYPKGSHLAFNGKVTDNNGNVAWTWLGEYDIPVSDQYYNNNTGSDRISISQWYEPIGAYWNSYQDKKINTNVSAQDGLQKVEIYINDQVVRSCGFNRAYNTQSCTYTIYQGNYSGYNQLRVYTKAYDYLGRQVQGATQYLYKDSYSNNGTTDSSVAAWFDAGIITDTLGRNDSRTITFRGNANRGLDKLELYANNNLVGTCDYNNAYGDQTCYKTIYGSNFSSGQTVNLKVKAIDRDGYYNYSGNISFRIEEYGSSNNDGVYVWQWFDPSDTNLDQNETAYVKVGASANNGLNRIEIYVNGSRIQTCNYNRVYGNQTCQVAVYGNNYNNNASIPVYAKAYDYNGYSAKSDTQYLYRNGSSNNNGNVSTWLTFSPSDTNFDQNETRMITATSNADDGLMKTEIYVNNNLIKTCTYNRVYTSNQCGVNVNGSNYSNGSTLSVYSKAYDYYGKYQTSQTQYLYRTNSTNNQSNNVYAWIWLEPSDTTLKQGETKTIKTGAAADAGLSKVVIYADGNAKRTCNFSRAYGNQACDVSINGYDFTANRNINIYAVAYDYNGRVKQTETLTVYVTGTNEETESNIQGQIDITTDHNNGYDSDDYVVFTATGSDGNGVEKIEIMVNATLVKTCTNATTCTYTGGTYGDRSSVTYGANLYDKLGNRLWTGYKTIFRK
ncbi:MAG: hypothetical protein ACOYUZ_02995 [Patescibacteria group bacterium]